MHLDSNHAKCEGVFILLIASSQKFNVLQGANVTGKWKTSKVFNGTVWRTAGQCVLSQLNLSSRQKCRQIVSLFVAFSQSP